MALTEEQIVDKIEIVGDYSSVQVRTATVIKRDGEEIGRSFHRHVVFPGNDHSNEDAKVGYLRRCSYARSSCRLSSAT